MASISGQSTSNIDQVDGFFTTQGGGSGITPNTLPASGATGTLLLGGGSMPANPLVTPDFNIGITTPVSFTKIQSGTSLDEGNKTVFIAITSTGELWGCFLPGSNWAFGAKDGVWRRYGTDSDWDDIGCDPEANCFSAIRNGELWFYGYGAAGQRGDGTTTSAGTWTMVNNALTWVKTSVGYSKIAVIDSNGHVYLSGRNYDYMTAQGTTSGVTTTLTRDQNNLTGVTSVFCDCYRSTGIIANGNVYWTGRNTYQKGGPLLTSTSNINGPTLSYNGGDMVSLSCNYFATMGVTTSGTLRFAGVNIFGARPDGGGSQSSTANAFDTIDGGATGYTFFAIWGSYTDRTFPVLAIQNGQLKIGGGTNSYVMKEALGYPANNTWRNVGATTAGAAYPSQYIITASW